MTTIGILGGMGPAAGADFYQRIVRTHGAAADQEHPPCILYSATTVPDRTAFLTGRGPDPTGALQDAAALLERAGADFISIPCNAAHAFLPAIREAVGIPILDLIAIAVDATCRQEPEARRVGLMAATGTARAGLYEEPLRRADRTPLMPDDALQELLMEGIRAVKAGAGHRPELAVAAGELADQGAEVVLMACTEVPLGLDPEACPVPLVDGNQALVEATLGLATGRLRLSEIAGSPPARDASGPRESDGEAREAGATSPVAPGRD